MTYLTLLGSTGSIGTSTLDVVRRWPERFGIYALVAGRNIQLLAQQIAEFKPKVAVVADDAVLAELRALLKANGTPVPELGAGSKARVAAAAAPEAGFVMSAIVGVEGLEATYEAVRLAKRVGLANKEVLVASGKLVTEAMRASGAELIPVDSEHNGAHQCFRAGLRREVSKLILTASGGPFRETSAADLELVTPEQALNHPTWKMGQRITVDSATLANKGFEVIEACWLFDLAPKEVEVVVHPQSKVHAMVEFADGSVMAQVSATDMRMPIQYALTYPERADAPVPRLDWSQAARWTFDPPDFKKFPLLKLAYQAQETGGSAACTLNAADEVAVEAFLAGRISYPGIAAIIAETLQRVPVREARSVGEVLEIDRESRAVARGIMEKGDSGRRPSGEKEKTEAAVPCVTQYMALLENIWWYLVLIGVMILVHELGHYFAARFFDVKVETFSFGFGPRLFGFRRGETDFRFSLILFGGYVKMTGEQPGDEGAADPRALTSKPRWQRLLIAFAGPAINIVLAVALLAGLFMVHYEKVPNPHSPVIGYLSPDGAATKAGVRLGDKVVQIDDTTDPTWEQIAIKGALSPNHPVDVWVMRGGEHLHLALTPALEEKESIGNAGWQQESDIEIAGVLKGMDGERVGLQRGDILMSVNGQPLRSIARLNEIENETSGAPLDLVYSRNGQQHQVTVRPAKRDAEGQGGARWMIGLSLEPRVEITKLAFPGALAESWRQNLLNTQLIVKSLEGIVQRKMSAKSLQGPIGIAQMSGDAAREGPIQYFLLMAAVSLNLAIFNLLPVPILDGGVMLMLFVEMLMRRDLDMKVKETVVKVGFVFLMFVVVFVIYNDISKIFPPG